MNDDNENHNDGPQKPKYIDGVGWRRDTIHRMTRWPEWKDSRKPGTYMFTLNITAMPSSPHAPCPSSSLRPPLTKSSFNVVSATLPLTSPQAI